MPLLPAPNKLADFRELRFQKFPPSFTACTGFGHYVFLDAKNRHLFKLAQVLPCGTISQGSFLQCFKKPNGFFSTELSILPTAQYGHQLWL